MQPSDFAELDDPFPDEVQAFISSLVPSDTGREEIAGHIIRFEGFTEICIDDLERRLALPASDPKHLPTTNAIHAEIAAEWQQKESLEPVAAGLDGSYPDLVQWAVFHPPQDLRDRRGGNAFKQ